MGKTNKGKELGTGIYQRANGTYEARYIDGKVKSEKRILSREEMEILLENSKGGMMYPIFVVALGTGMCIGEILGHNSLQMTMDLYCHVRESTLTDEMERIANFI